MHGTYRMPLLQHAINLRPRLRLLVVTAQIISLLLPSTVLAQKRESSQVKKAGRVVELVQAVPSITVLPSEQKRYALVIGVNQYQEIGALGGAVNDARLLAEALVRYAGFPEDHVVRLSSDQPATLQPTRANILGRLSAIKRLLPEDGNGMLLIAFAGHGMEREGHTFLLPSDAQTADTQLLEDTAISVERLKERILATGVKQVILILDSCRTNPEGARADGNVLLPALLPRQLDFSVRNGNTKQGAIVEVLRESEGLKGTLRELGNGAVILYTILGENRYDVILITPDVQKSASYPIKADDLRRKVLEFREALEDYNRAPRPLAQELYKILVEPIADDLQDADAKTLMWSLDGVLRYVPMAALHDGKGYLVERFRNVLFTLASYDRLKDVPSASWNVLGLGVSKSLGSLGALPTVSAELREIIKTEDGSAGILPGKLLLDEAITEEAMKSAMQQRYPVAHIASHFQFQPGDETNSFLLLGDGTRLSLAEIRASTKLFSGVELLVLSASETTAGANGTEVEGLAEVAQRKGAKALLITLWSVVDESNIKLMRGFYIRRRDQPTMFKVEALRQAQLELLRGKESHPYYWAPYILTGNWK